MIAKTLGAVALLLATPACAQTAAPPTPAAASDADPALWVVKDADTTIYLFGTIHVLKPGMTWFDEGVKSAFDQSDTLVLEMVQPDAATMQQLVMSKGMATDGVALPDRLPKASRRAYAKALAKLGLPAGAFDRTEPWLAATNLSIVPIMKLGYDVTNGPEKVLADAAAQGGKQVIGLETAAQQIGYFDDLSMPAQVQFLTATLDDMPNVPQEMAAMVADWAAGKPDALAALLNDDMKDSPEVKTTLLTDRNARWATWIHQRMATPGTVFVAVGAGHLAGDESVIADLARTYKVNAVRVSY